MISKKITITIFLGIAALIIGAAHLTNNITGFVVRETENPIVIDVRTLPEFLEERIPDSILMPYDTIMFNIEEVVPDKDIEIIIYCRTGRRSSIAKETLRSMGYTNVKDIGGIIDWTGPTTSGIDRN